MGTGGSVRAPKASCFKQLFPIVRRLGGEFHRCASATCREICIGRFFPLESISPPLRRAGMIYCRHGRTHRKVPCRGGHAQARDPERQIRIARTLPERGGARAQVRRKPAHRGARATGTEARGSSGIPQRLRVVPHLRRAQRDRRARRHRPRLPQDRLLHGPLRLHRVRRARRRRRYLHWRIGGSVLCPQSGRFGRGCAAAGGDVVYFPPQRKAKTCQQNPTNTANSASRA